MSFRGSRLKIAESVQFKFRRARRGAHLIDHLELPSSRGNNRIDRDSGMNARERQFLRQRIRREPEPFGGGTA